MVFLLFLVNSNKQDLEQGAKMKMLYAFGLKVAESQNYPSNLLTQKNAFRMGKKWLNQQRSKYIPASVFIL